MSYSLIKSLIKHFPYFDLENYSNSTNEMTKIEKGDFCEASTHQSAIITITLKSQLWQEDTEKLSSALSYILLLLVELSYRSGTVNSKSFVGKVLLRIKWKFKLN